MPNRKNTLETLLARLAVVEHSGCWEYTRARDKGGYGKFMLNRRHERAHRASYILHIGPIPEGLWVLHKCDNPPCCNPNHLFLGTPLDNQQDRRNKGRHGLHGSVTHPHRWRSGEESARAKVTWKQVKEIRALEGKVSCRRIAEQYGVSDTLIRGIIGKQMWWPEPSEPLIIAS
jgi:hypothetical protein